MEHEPNQDAQEPSPFRVHLPPACEEVLPENFTPLRLVLQPSGATVAVQRRVVVIGRHSECDIRLPLPDVSRHHCRLEFTENCWQVIDTNSLNGIFLNGERVLQACVQDGDHLRIGGFTFAVTINRQTDDQTVPPMHSLVNKLLFPNRRKAS
jgi:pSer/pThr/pTyr-binding forkhead associated (FHA) protein